MQQNPFKERNNKGPFLRVVDENPDVFQSHAFEAEKQEDSLYSSSKKTDSDPPGSKRKDCQRDQDAPFMSSFLVELIHTIKKSLISIRNTSFSQKIGLTI